MDLDPNDDQRALVEMVAAFAADRFDSERARGFADRFDRDAWGIRRSRWDCRGRRPAGGAVGA